MRSGMAPRGIPIDQFWLSFKTTKEQHALYQQAISLFKNKEYEAAARTFATVAPHADDYEEAQEYVLDAGVRLDKAGSAEAAQNAWRLVVHADVIERAQRALAGEKNIKTRSSFFNKKRMAWLKEAGDNLELLGAMLGLVGTFVTLAVYYEKRSHQ